MASGNELQKKRYYWLKLPKNFFKNARIKKLRKIAGGDTYTIIYLKLMLLCIDNEGIVIYEGIENTLEEELALKLDEEKENVLVTLNFLKTNELLIEKEEGDVYLPEAYENTGSETHANVCKKRQRNNLRLENVQPMSNQCPTEIDIDIEKEIDIRDRYKKVDNNLIDNNKEKNKNACTPEFISMLLRIVKDKLPEMEDSTYISLEGFLKTLSKSYSQKNIEVSVQHALLGVLENYSNIENTFGYLRNAIAINCEQFKEGSYQYDN